MTGDGSDIVVMKFGGTSVAGAEQIKRAAGRIVAAREAGNRVVAVLSARGKTTDELVDAAHEISERPVAREMDMLLSTGERISCALCAMAIHDMGHEAISLTGSQAGIVTDSSHTKARIIDVRADRISEALMQDRIVLVAGFQGVSTDSRDVTRLAWSGLSHRLGAATCCSSSAISTRLRSGSMTASIELKALSSSASATAKSGPATMIHSTWTPYLG